MSQPLTFEALRDSWDKLKTLKAADFKKAVPGLVNINAVIVKRVSEDQQYITVEFKNIDHAVTTPTTDIPLMNKTILNWLREISTNVQTTRGGGPSLIVRMSKLVKSAIPAADNLNTTPKTAPKYDQSPAPARPKSLTNITAVRPVENQ